MPQLRIICVALISECFQRKDFTCFSVVLREGLWDLAADAVNFALLTKGLTDVKVTS